MLKLPSVEDRPPSATSFASTSLPADSSQIFPSKSPPRIREVGALSRSAEALWPEGEEPAELGELSQGLLGLYSVADLSVAAGQARHSGMSVAGEMD